jgi:DNA-binding NarL/FixJ family response regulator
VTAHPNPTDHPGPTDHVDLPVRLLLADDHPVVRAGLRAVLETEPGLVVVAEAATAEEAVLRAGAGDVDVVLMDLRFGTGMGGAEATAAITARPGAPRVVIVTTYDSDADTLPAIEAGATGYLLKDAPPEELAAAVRSAAAGRTALAPAVADRLMNRLRAPGTSLTRRETEVLALVAEGLSNQAVGRRLHLTEGTVKSHLARVYAKLGVDSRTAAVAAATDLGLIRRP